MAGGGQEEAASLNSVVQQCVEVNQYQQQQQAEHDINAATGDSDFIYYRRLVEGKPFDTKKEWTSLYLSRKQVHFLTVS